MNISPLTTQIIGIIMLMFTINLSLRNLVIDRHTTKDYITSAFLIIVILITEIIETFITINMSTAYILTSYI